MSTPTVTELVYAGTTMKKEVFDNNRVQFSLEIEGSAAESICDLSIANLEQRVVNAQRQSFSKLITDDMLKGKADTGDYEIRSNGVKSSFQHNNLPPIDTLPKDVVEKKIDKDKFMNSDLVPERIKKSFFGKPYFTSNIKSGSMNVSEILTIPSIEKDQTHEEWVLQNIFELQELNDDLQEQIDDLKNELKAELTAKAEEITEGLTANTAVYFHAHSDDLGFNARFSMSKSARFSYKDAGDWAMENLKNPDSVFSLGVNSYKLKKLHPEIYKNACVTETSFAVFQK